jgi:threonine aldolase
MGPERTDVVACGTGHGMWRRAGRSMMLPEAPQSSFASDNTAGVAPAVLDALVAANVGPAAPYGADPWTAAFDEHIAALFGSEATGLLTYGGTGANVVALATLVRPWEGIVCPASAHINVDECGAPERFTGCKLIDVATVDGKLRPDDVAGTLGSVGFVHAVQPGAISVTQVTEYGTVYSVEELAAVCGTARDAGLRVHMDGARIANAAAALGVPVREFTVEVGVDVLSFGATKNGAAFGEAVVVFDPALAEAAAFLRKQAGQLASKMRFVAAQFVALLDEDRWLHQAAHANAMAQRLAAAAGTIDGVEITQVPQANAVFARLDRPVIEQLTSWSPFYVWAPDLDAARTGATPRDEVRWMTSFATTPDDVDRFVEGIAVACGDVT